MYCGPNCSTVPPQLLKQQGSTLQLLSNHPHHMVESGCLATTWLSIWQQQTGLVYIPYLLWRHNPDVYE